MNAGEMLLVLMIALAVFAALLLIAAMFVKDDRPDDYD